MEELQDMGINLIMVSIGKPEVGQELIQHLDIPEAEKYLFVDPENSLYDSLELNKGLKETFFSVSTPYAFLDRFTKRDGVKELMEVLSKYNKAIYMPPKLDQGFNQGGTFIFDGAATIFAHFDESTGAHPPMERVLDLAKSRISR